MQNSDTWANNSNSSGNGRTMGRGGQNIVQNPCRTIYSKPFQIITKRPLHNYFNLMRVQSFSYSFSFLVCTSATHFTLCIYLILFFSRLFRLHAIKRCFCLPLPFLAFNNFFLSLFFRLFVSYLLAFTVLFLARRIERVRLNGQMSGWASEQMEWANERTRSQRFYYCYFFFYILLPFDIMVQVELTGRSGGWTPQCMQKCIKSSIKFNRSSKMYN